MNQVLYETYSRSPYQSFMSRDITGSPSSEYISSVFGSPINLRSAYRRKTFKETTEKRRLTPIERIKEIRDKLFNVENGPLKAKKMIDFPDLLKEVDDTLNILKSRSKTTHRTRIKSQFKR